jgi:hypothetical protein
VTWFDDPDGLCGEPVICDLATQSQGSVKPPGVHHADLYHNKIMTLGELKKGLFPGTVNTFNYKPALEVVGPGYN